MPPDDRTGWESALVVIPTYDEADNIEAILTAVTTAVPEASVLVVDDGSPDGTSELVEKAVETDPRIHLLRGEGKRGLGQAYVAGFHWGLDHGYGLFVEMDADFSHDPAAIPDLLGAAAEADVVVGSRYIPGATGGFRCYRRAVLEAVDLPGVRSNGYAFQIDMTYRAWRLGFRLAEVPITFRERELGTSKMSGSIVREALVAVARWGLRDRLRGRRRPGAY
ncbi:MAG: polyprenol monophosphomannose synthase [Actinobacteria bacterium]|nr:MAG: polyprenol monophosphomannose synthase [Actinomycetota bacterium]